MATDSIQPIAGIGTGFSATDNSSVVSSSTANSLGMNSFMTLFLTQLQHQDPTNPMESYQLASQLAQFSSVEKMTQVTSLLKNLQDYASGINNAEITALVGKDITAQRNVIDVTATGVSQLNYNLDAPASVNITVQDSRGNTVYKSDLGAQAAGSYSVQWDGKDSSGKMVPAGSYSCDVTATGSDGTQSAAQTTIQGQVYSCKLDSAPPSYILSGPDGVSIPVSSVFKVNSQSSSLIQ